MFNGMTSPGKGDWLRRSVHDCAAKTGCATVPVPFFSANPPRGRKKSAAGLIQIKEPYSLG